MTELIRDTAFGHLVRFLSRGKYLKYQEEADPSIWTRYVDEKKSAYLAHHGSTEPPEENINMEGVHGVRTREDQPAESPSRASSEKDSETSKSSKRQSSDQQQGRAKINHASGMKVDPEKGKDYHIVTWYGDDDPDNVSAAT